MPAARTSATPSLPGTADGAAVERVVVKGGLEGYVPWSWLISAGFKGLARKRRVRRLEWAGEMECVWRLEGFVY